MNRRISCMDTQYTELEDDARGAPVSALHPCRAHLRLLMLACLVFGTLLMYVQPFASLARGVHLQAELGPVIETACGTFIGKWEHDGPAPVLASFRGIQFGRAQRWLPPQAICYGSGHVQEAVVDGPACLKHDGTHEGEDEECLYLNLFRPSGDMSLGIARQLPIIVYIHGGGLDSGSATSDGRVDRLASLTGELIVVACQYRLGVLGFMALRELSRRDPRGVSGNYGFLDQQLCLQWVRRHGAAFGGDVSRVTVLGQSAGGTSVLAHLVSGGSQGLFHRAIALSASPGAPRMGQAEKERQDRRLWLPTTGCAAAADALGCLLAMDARSLANSLPREYGLFGTSDYPIEPGPAGRIPWKSLCHVDGVTVSAQVDSALRTDVPLLIGSMAAEMAASASLPSLTGSQAWGRFLSQRFSHGFGAHFVEQLQHAYNGTESPALAAYEIDSDTGSFCGLLRIAHAAASASSSPVYVGRVEAGPEHPSPWCDCSREVRFPFHGWDLAAATEVWNQLWCTCARYAPAEPDRLFASQLRKRWLELAKTGQLSPASGWTSLTFERAYATIHHHGVAMKPLPAQRCQFWEAHNVTENWYWVN